MRHGNNVNYNALPNVSRADNYHALPNVSRAVNYHALPNVSRAVNYRGLPNVSRASLVATSADSVPSSYLVHITIVPIGTTFGNLQ